MVNDMLMYNGVPLEVIFERERNRSLLFGGNAKQRRKLRRAVLKMNKRNAEEFVKTNGGK